MTSQVGITHNFAFVALQDSAGHDARRQEALQAARSAVESEQRRVEWQLRSSHGAM